MSPTSQARGRGAEFSVADRQVLFRDAFVAAVPHANYDVAPGGRELVMIEAAGGRSRFVVTLNWDAELRKRLSGQGTAR